ncbi:WXG100 family type VII secretion target [Arthrobacter sp. HY1533]|uniref:WXG100 family type VII secretion target n=1 Tax=Arthrobacter sp. HY1533 TaxID=2970919 RepID=UPI0022B9F52A|nr:hypothetical protein [Arthrobacter sp. HY1533]
MDENMLGADPEQLRALAKLFSKYSSVLDTTAGDLNPTIMRARWNGPDAQQFRQQWAARMRPQLKSASELFEDTSRRLNAQAREQEQASSESSLGGGPGGSGGSGSTGTSKSELQEQLEGMGTWTGQEVTDWWNGLSEEQRQELLNGKDGDGIPNAYYLAALEDKLPEDARVAARDILVDNAKASIPMYAQKDTIGVDGQLAWVHGGAHLSSQIIQNADGSVSLKLSGDVGGGVNTPSTKGGANATLTGELSKTYKFNSLQEALAAREQMLNSLPPDSFSRASDAVKNPGEYIEGTLDKAARDNGTTKEYMSAKGTLSFGVEGKVSSDASASAKLDLAYEQNLDDGTSSASATAKVTAKLDLGDGMKFGGNGEAGVKLSMDKDGDIQKMTINLKGTVEGSVKVQAGASDPMADMFGPKPPSEGPSAQSKAGVQGTVQLELYTTDANRHLVESYMGNLASGNVVGAAGDLQEIYHASAVTTQLDSTVSAETNVVDFDSGVASLKVGATSEATVNAGTAHKSPYDDDFHGIRGEARYEPQK